MFAMREHMLDARYDTATLGFCPIPDIGRLRTIRDNQ
jgi:hypothetical protein